jgi:hypothetical protein
MFSFAWNIPTRYGSHSASSQFATYCEPWSKKAEHRVNRHSLQSLRRLASLRSHKVEAQSGMEH